MRSPLSNAPRSSRSGMSTITINRASFCPVAAIRSPPPARFGRGIAHPPVEEFGDRLGQHRLDRRRYGFDRLRRRCRDRRADPFGRSPVARRFVDQHVDTGVLPPANRAQRGVMPILCEFSPHPRISYWLDLAVNLPTST